jgi:hypothetical protein
MDWSDGRCAVRAVLRAVFVTVARMPLSVMVVLAGLVVAGAALGGGSGASGGTGAVSPAGTGTVVTTVAMTVPATTGWGGDNGSDGGSGNGRCTGPSGCGPSVALSGGGQLPGQQAGGSAPGMDFGEHASAPVSGGGVLGWLSTMLGLHNGPGGGDRKYHPDDGGSGPWTKPAHKSESKPGSDWPERPDTSGSEDDPGRAVTLPGHEPGTGDGGRQTPLDDAGRGLLAWVGSVVSRILGAIAGVIDQAATEIQSGKVPGSDQPAQHQPAQQQPAQQSFTPANAATGSGGAGHGDPGHGDPGHGDPGDGQAAGDLPGTGCVAGAGRMCPLAPESSAQPEPGRMAATGAQRLPAQLTPVVDLVSNLVGLVGGQPAGIRTRQALTGVLEQVTRAISTGAHLGADGPGPGAPNADRSPPPGSSNTSRTSAVSAPTSGHVGVAALGPNSPDRPGRQLDRPLERTDQLLSWMRAVTGARGPPTSHQPDSQSSPDTPGSSGTGPAARLHGRTLQVPTADGGTLGITPTSRPGPNATVTPDLAGGRYLIVARNRQAPSTYAFDLSMPAGSHAVTNRDGGVDLVNTAGATTQTIDAPWALDATGAPVRTYFTVHGATLTQHIAPGPDSLYPILADPAAGGPVLDDGTPVPAADRVAKPAKHAVTGTVNSSGVDRKVAAKPKPRATGTVNSSGVDRTVAPKPKPRARARATGTVNSSGVDRVPAVSATSTVNSSGVDRAHGVTSTSTVNASGVDTGVGWKPAVPNPAAGSTVNSSEVDWQPPAPPNPAAASTVNSSGADRPTQGGVPIGTHSTVNASSADPGGPGALLPQVAGTPRDLKVGTTEWRDPTDGRVYVATCHDGTSKCELQRWNTETQQFEQWGTVSRPAAPGEDLPDEPAPGVGWKPPTADSTVNSSEVDWQPEPPAPPNPAAASTVNSSGADRPTQGGVPIGTHSTVNSSEADPGGPGLSLPHITGTPEPKAGTNEWYDPEDGNFYTYTCEDDTAAHCKMRVFNPDTRTFGVPRPKAEYGDPGEAEPVDLVEKELDVASNIPWGGRGFKVADEAYQGLGKVMGYKPREAANPSSPTRSEPTQIEAAKPPKQVNASWSGETVYHHGGRMTAIQHINYRHSYNSGFANVSKYSQGTTARQIRGYVDDGLRYGTPTPNGTNGHEIVYDTGHVIGTDKSGAPVTAIKIYVRDGRIQSAFPVKAP